MLKKIILPLILLIFTQQNFYGMYAAKTNNPETLVMPKGKDQSKIWETINNWVNVDVSDGIKRYPRLWWLWAILDNVPFQYGNSKIWKHGEAYYGLSNGIGFFPSFLNFRWLKIGIGDAHINVINLILDSFKNYIQYKSDGQDDILGILLVPIFINLLFNIHIFSFKIWNCIKIKLLAPLTIWVLVGDKELFFVDGSENKDSTACYITYNNDDQISWWYALLSPRIEINIPEIINYFKGR